MFCQVFLSNAYACDSELIGRPRVIRACYEAFSDELIHLIVQRGVGQTGSSHAVCIPIVWRNFQRFFDWCSHPVDRTFCVESAGEFGIAAKLSGIDRYRLLAKIDRRIEQMIFAM